MRVEKDFRDFLKLLNEKRVKYLIVGGFAYSYYAEPRYTKDIDIFVDMTKENAEKIISAVTEFWGKRSELTVDDLLEKDKIIQLGYAPIRIDIATSLAKIKFPQAWKNRVKATYGDIDVFFISLEDLIKNKKATGRDRDLLDAKYLNKIKKFRSGRSES
jgi:predicted nucleotidyltransferase